MTFFKSLILNFDHSVGDVNDASQIDLTAWQETIRFGASVKTFSKFVNCLNHLLPQTYGTALLGSGDYHHLSWPLIERYENKGPFQVVIFDNHPDNMRFPWRIHCGSWVRRVALLPYVSHVHVVGITSHDIGLGAAWEQYWGPLLKGKLTYWSMQVDVRWANYIGLGQAFRSYATPDALIAGFLQELPRQPTYLSIDKDVLALTEARTNWDQGQLLERHLMQTIDALRSHIIGSDITGEVSQWRYQTWWKRLFSALDGQKAIPMEQLKAWQRDHHALNQRLLAAIAGSRLSL